MVWKHVHRLNALLVAVAAAVTLIAGALAPTWGQVPQAPPAAQPAAAAPVLAGVVGPYVQNIGANNATICWATRTGEVTCVGPDGKPIAARDWQHHSVPLRNLQPGTAYSYDVLGDGSDATLRSSDTSLRSTSLGKGSFTTYPEGEHSFNFAVLGDPRSAIDTYKRVLARVAPEKPDMIFMTGDLVGDGLQLGQWEDFFNAGNELMRSVPMYPALGNHDLDSSFYFDFFSLPGNERYYSFNRGSAHFVVLDTFGPRMRDVYWRPGQLVTNQPVTERELKEFEEHKERYWRDQLAWLRDDLAGSQGAKYIFVFFHHPQYTVLAKALEGAKQMRERFGAVFQDYGVSAVFTGHYHHYHRAIVGGVQLVTTAGAGANLYETDAPQPETVKYAKVHHFVRVDVGPDAAKARVVDVDGNTIDEFELLARVQAAVSAPAPAQ